MRRKKNKKIDIYTALMLPLMTMFLLNIGLVATTWAWYTASVSSGMSTIKAGVDVSVEVFKEGVNAPIELPNNCISLEANNNYTFKFTPGSAANGYYALITVSNPKTVANPLINLFTTTTYADEPTSSYAVALSPNQNDATITMLFLQNKDVSISYIWRPSDLKPSENSTITYGEQQYELVEIGKTITNEEVYTVHFVGTDNSSKGEQTYTVDKNEVEIEVSATEGYYFQPEGEVTIHETQKFYSVEKFVNHELTVTVVPDNAGTNSNSTNGQAEEEEDAGETTPGNVSGYSAEPSIPAESVKEGCETPEESASYPSQFTENPTSEPATTPSTESVDEQGNAEVDGEEDEAQTEMKTEGMEADSYAQSKTGE